MTRMSKQGKRRAQSPRRRKANFPKTGPKRDKLEFGYKVHKNALSEELSSRRFFPVI